jgi:hypothetical protein
VGGGAGPSNDNAGAGPEQFGQEVFAQFLDQAAEGLVDLQLVLQALAVKRITGKAPPPVVMDEQLRKVSAKAWAVQLRIWIPDDIPLPAWALAVVPPLLYIPAQVAAARKAAPDGESAQKAAA